MIVARHQGVTRAIVWINKCDLVEECRESLLDAGDGLRGDDHPAFGAATRPHNAHRLGALRAALLRARA